MKAFLTILIFVMGISAFAQEKREVERRIKESDVPNPAVNWINNAFNKRNGIKWYEEISSGKLSYEAKFKWKGQRYSVEFNQSGIIEDIEIRMSLKNLSDDFRIAFLSYLDENYTKYKITKIQEQWTGDGDALMIALHEENTSSITVRYEIEFYGKNESEDELWEGLFDQSGNLHERKRIILRPLDNLLY